MLLQVSDFTMIRALLLQFLILLFQFFKLRFELLGHFLAVSFFVDEFLLKISKTFTQHVRLLSRHLLSFIETRLIISNALFVLASRVLELQFTFSELLLKFCDVTLGVGLFNRHMTLDFIVVLLELLFSLDSFP